MAVMGGADWIQAESAAWAGWGLAMDPKAAKAYDKEFAASQNRKKAMRAFWDACNPLVPRPQEKIAAVLANKSGLRLERGREITWSIAERKIKNGELFLGVSPEAEYVQKLPRRLFLENIYYLLRFAFSHDAVVYAICLEVSTQRLVTEHSHGG